MKASLHLALAGDLVNFIDGGRFAQAGIGKGAQVMHHAVGVKKCMRVIGRIVQGRKAHRVRSDEQQRRQRVGRPMVLSFVRWRNKG